MRRGCLILLAALSVLGSTRVVGQVPTPEQLELLRSMSPEDREALMEQLGVGGGMLGDSQSSQDQDRDSSRRNRTGTQMDPRRGALDARDALVLDNRFRPGDSLLIDIDFKKDQPPRVVSQGEGAPPVTVPGELAPVLTPEVRAQLEVRINLVRARNPYELDSRGQILLPGFAPIMLAGLDADQATKRLAAEPSLRDLELKVLELPVRKSGIAGLQPFGYDLFKESPSTFAPVTDVPVPADYVVGPGDRLNVQLFGGQNRNLRLTVDRDGRVNFPELGPITVAGRTFAAVASDLEARVERQMIGVRAAISMGDTRSIRVFVMGEVTRPGSYTVSGLGTLISALYAAGGIKPIGSLRDVQLKRSGAVVRRLDLYDLLLRGDTSDDAKLLPGDVIFIPPVSATVAVDGEVKRPAIYEIKGETSVDDIIRLAGGLTPEADPSRVALVRVDATRARVVLDVPLELAPGSRSEILRNGDSLRVLRLRPTLDRGVTVEGHVFRTGPVAWREGLRLTDVLSSVDELKPNADINYVLVRRETPPDRHVEIHSADLAAALRDPSSAENIELKPRDRIVVFDVTAGRHQLLDPVLSELRRQASINEPSAVVRVDGRIKARGDYPLEPQMRISDLLRAGGGLQDAAYGAKAELTRYTVGQVRSTQLIDVDLGAVLNGDLSADLLLQPFDFLNVKEIPEWSDQEQVTLHGEVRFPGIYPIARGETLRSVLARAGGPTSLAFLEGSVFTRVELRDREQEQLDRLAERLQGDLAAAALQAATANQGQAGQALTVGQSLLNQLKATRAVGRMVIDLDELLAAAPGSASDVALRAGDSLMIPKQKQEVTVIGEVQSVTSHFYRENLSRDDYVALSGGVTRKADRDRIYIVRANGSVISSESSGWFRRSGQVAMRPGDTVVVPLDTERMPALPLVEAVTGIISNLAVAAAAIASFQ